MFNVVRSKFKIVSILQLIMFAGRRHLALLHNFAFLSVELIALRHIKEDY